MPRWEDHDIDKKLVILLQISDPMTFDMACTVLGVTWMEKNSTKSMAEQKEVDASIKRLKAQGLAAYDRRKRGWIYVKPTPRRTTS